MQTALQSLIQVPGVSGAAVFDLSGDCLAESLEPPYEPILLAEVVSRLREVYDNYVALDDAAGKAVALVFEEGHLLIRSLDNITVVAIASRVANLAMLGVALNVAGLKLSRAAASRAPADEIVPQPSAPPPQPIAAVAHGDPYVGGAPSPAASPPPLPAGLATGSTNTGNSVSVSWTAERLDVPAPPDAVGLRVMRHVLKSLMRQIGREGKPVLEEELYRIGATPATVTGSQFTDLIMAVARRIPNAAARDAFMSDALGD